MKKISQNTHIHLNKKVLQLNVNYPHSSPRGRVPVQWGPAEKDRGLGLGPGVFPCVGGRAGIGEFKVWKSTGSDPREPTDTTEILGIPDSVADGNYLFRHKFISE